MLGFTGMVLLGPWPFKLIIDYVLFEKSAASAFPLIQKIVEGEKLTAVFIFSFCILLIAILKGTFAYFQILLTSRIGFELVHKLRRELFAHLQRLSLSFHEQTRSGELLTKITGDTKSLRTAFSESTLSFGAHVLTLTGMLSVMLFLNWKLTIIAMSTFPIHVYVLSKLYKRMKKLVKKERKREGNIASRINEILPVISLVQSFSREEHESQLFDADSRKTLKQSIRVANMGASTSRTVEIVKALGVSATILYGSLEVIEGSLSPGDLLVFSSYTRGMYNPISKITNLLAKFSKAMASAERVSDLLETEIKIVDRAGALEIKHLKGEIHFKDVCFGYTPQKRVFDQVSFSIQAGQNIALVGASGSGKSTIAKLILRLYDIQGGAIFIDGLDIRDYKRESLRQQIGIVDQASVLFGISIRENILYGKPGASEREVSEAARLAYAHEFISSLPDGYDTIVGERGGSLSGGQRQRIGLARSIIKQPSLLILDEPTSAVDAESATLIHESMDQFQAGRTSLVIIHQFNAIQNFDQIIALKQGKVIEIGTHKELITRNGYYADLYRHQQT
jgi:ATP-binding cassette, subfamily B, bacterial